MNDPHDNAQTDREMAERYAGTDDDTAEIESIVQEIVSECGLSENSERRIREILIRRVREASNAYSYRMAREETVSAHTERPTRLADGRTFCACGQPWPCPRAGDSK